MSFANIFQSRLIKNQSSFLTPAPSFVGQQQQWAANREDRATWQPANLPTNLATWPTNLANQWANSREKQPETWNCVPRPPWHFWSCLVSEQSILQISHSLATWISSCFAFTVSPNLSLLPFIAFSFKLSIDHLTPFFQKFQTFLMCKAQGCNTFYSGAAI